MDIEKAIKINNTINSEIKLTKSGEHYSTASKEEIVKVLKVSQNMNKLNLNDLLGVVLNPLLTSEQIRQIFELLSDHNKYDSEKSSLSSAKTSITKNMGIRGKIRKWISLHPNLDSNDIDSLLLSKSTINSPTVLNNTNITKSQLDDFFQRKVMSSTDSYNFITFKDLIISINVTPIIALGWYKQLSKKADWHYKDNKWYSIIDSYLSTDICPYEVLKDIVTLSVFDVDGGDSFFNLPLRYTRAVIKHKNAKPTLLQLAYEKTGLEEFLPQEVKDIFLF